MISFSRLGLVDALQSTLRDERYTQPTPIQAQAIPPLLEGRDLLGCARTGTGKTAAFALPILQRFANEPRRVPARSARALVLVPTRELAAQVAASFTTYGKRLSPRVALVYGGVKQGAQVRALAGGVDVLVATPGRLLDLMQQKHVSLAAVEVVVLDEADHMLDLGFLPDVRRILSATPKRRQTLLFSATMPEPIAQLANGILQQPVKVFADPVSTTVEQIEQRVQFVARNDKVRALAGLLADRAIERALVFTRTKRGADRVARRLVQESIPAAALHGNKTQSARERTMSAFRDGRIRVLVATDIAARGIDVDGITHVVNYELPEVPETYVHRIGRTARAGAAGAAISLCDEEERPLLRDIEKLIRRKVAPSDAVLARERPGARATQERGGDAARPRARGHGAKAQRGRERTGSHERAGTRAGSHARSGSSGSARHARTNGAGPYGGGRSSSQTSKPRQRAGSRAHASSQRSDASRGTRSVASRHVTTDRGRSSTAAPAWASGLHGSAAI